MLKLISTLSLAIGLEYAEAGTLSSQALSQPQIYIGGFSSVGALKSTPLSQLGTAFYQAPVAVNAFGQSNSQTQWVLGGFAGHLFNKALINTHHQVFIHPAAEIEGYYIGQQNIRGSEVVNTTAANEHIFKVTYPTSTNLGLINAVAYFENANHPTVQPYIGAGFGIAAVSINAANSEQITPAEPGVNHYNTDPSDTDTTFASQIKAGLNYKPLSNFAIFAEYRYLYLSSTDFTFGSTYYPAPYRNPPHVLTTNWTVKLGGQQYQLGAIGLRYYF